MDKQQRIPLTPKKQKRAATLAFLLIAALFLVASLQTQYTPVEFLLNMENFWSFIFVDLLPPKIADWETIGMGAVSYTHLMWSSPYLGWDYNDPETAVLGVAFHSFEWLFVRVAPVIFIAAIIGIFFTCKKE